MTEARGLKKGESSLFVHAPAHVKPELGFVHAGFLPVLFLHEGLVGTKAVLHSNLSKQIIKVDVKSATANARVIRVKFADNSFGHAFELPDGSFTLFVRPKDK